MKSLVIFLSLSAFFVLFIAVDAVAQCKTAEPAFSTAFRGDPNADVNDYGRIHVDAENPACAQSAMVALTAKLHNHLTNPQNLALVDPTKLTFQQWLDGYLVQLIYGAAMRIGANGWSSGDLDDQLVLLAQRFQHYTGPPPSGACGGDELNTCMDDLAGTAGGYAWMAAYKSRRLNRFTQADVDATRAQAETFINDALSPVTSSTDRSHGVCIRRLPLTGSSVPLCNGNLTDLTSIFTPGQTLSLNGQTQMIHYGFGLMTTIAAAKLGIKEAGGTDAFSANQIMVARALMEEAQRHIYSWGEFKSDCIYKDTNGNLVTGFDCGRGYRPNMYRLKPAYDRYFYGVTSAGPYVSNNFDQSLFALGPDTATGTGHFSFGRYVAYGVEGNTWIENEPEM